MLSSRDTIAAFAKHTIQPLNLALGSKATRTLEAKLSTESTVEAPLTTATSPQIGDDINPQSLQFGG
jgi:hypothetical protein